VYCIPGISGNHLLSIFGDSGKAAGSKLRADPGPQRSGPVGVGEAVGDGVSDAAVGDAESVDPADVNGAGAAFCPEHDTTVNVATNRMRAEPSIGRRSCGWDISVAFAFGIPGHPEGPTAPPAPDWKCVQAYADGPRSEKRDKGARNARIRSLGEIHRGKIAPSPPLETIADSELA
jgi:hypothetical protein